jgi:hypothetical protein
VIGAVERARRGSKTPTGFGAAPPPSARLLKMVRGEALDESLRKLNLNGKVRRIPG